MKKTISLPKIDFEIPPAPKAILSASNVQVIGDVEPEKKEKQKRSHDDIFRF